MGFELVGKVWTPESFREWIAGQNLGWANGITMHHTGTPSLEQRPHGFKAQHLRNLQHFYQVQKKWSAGPHLFVDDDQIWGLSSLSRPGVHAKSFNYDRIGIEVLGNYDVEDPARGRGKKCWDTAAACVRAILEAQGWDVGRVNGHRDDPKTSKSCPGAKVDLDAFRETLTSGPMQEEPIRDETFLQEIKERLGNIDWQVHEMLRQVEERLG